MRESASCTSKSQKSETNAGTSRLEPEASRIQAPTIYPVDTSPVARALTAATGFCELGMWQEAWHELETLAPEDCAHLCVDLLRLQILVGLQKWYAAAILAESLVEMGSTAPEPFLLGAYAIRRCRSMAEGEAFLLRGAPHLQGKATWHYNLACYACQRGDLEGAMAKLAEAFRLNSNLRNVALEDEDLQPLWSR